MSSCPNSPLPHRAISTQGLLFESETMTSRATIASHIRSRSWPTVEVPAEEGGEEASQIDLSIDSSTEVELEFGDDGSVRLVLLSSGEGGDPRIGSSLLRPYVHPSVIGTAYQPRKSTICIPAYYALAERRSPKQEEETGGVPLPLRPPKRSQITKRVANLFKKKRHTGVISAASSLTSGQTKPSVKIGLGTTNIGLAHIISYEELNQATNSFTHELADGGVPLPSRPLKRSQITKRVAKIFRWMLYLFKKKRHTVTLRSSGGTAAANSLTSGQTKPSVKIELRTTNIGLAHIFSYEELNQATNSFTHELADGGFSRVYLGKLQDDRKVAVKVLYEGIPKRMEQFLNEVTVLSRLRHKNLVSLYGCTDPESQKLLLVYELVPNGTISDHLHGQLPSLTWDVRMQISIETAEALSYLHSCEPPIIHRDVKTSNILLDDDFHAKVADLGMCRLVPWDTTSVSTLPQGTVGYRDPEYDELCKLTLKSDVYSFGVVLLELISGKQAVDVYREETEIYLFKMAVKKILNKELDQLVDLRIGYGSNSEISRMVSSVAALSCVCLQPKADPRPTMVEVLQILKGIRDGMHYA